MSTRAIIAVALDDGTLLASNVAYDGDETLAAKLGANFDTVEKARRLVRLGDLLDVLEDGSVRPTPAAAEPVAYVDLDDLDRGKIGNAHHIHLFRDNAWDPLLDDEGQHQQELLAAEVLAENKRTASIEARGERIGKSGHETRADHADRRCGISGQAERGAPAPVGVLDPSITTSTHSAFDGAQRGDARSASTFDAVLLDERTSLTRFPADGPSARYAALRSGQTVRFYEDREMRGRKVDVVVTSVAPRRPPPRRPHPAGGVVKGRGLVDARRRDACGKARRGRPDPLRASRQLRGAGGARGGPRQHRHQRRVRGARPQFRSPARGPGGGARAEAVMDASAAGSPNSLREQAAADHGRAREA